MEERAIKTRWRHRLRLLAGVLGLAGICFATGWLGTEVARRLGNGSSLWLLPGMALAGLVLAAVVAQRRQGQLRLRQSEEQFRVLIEESPIALALVDQAGRISLVNAQAERLFGYRREELLGQSVEILVPEQVRSKHVALRDAFLARPEARPLGAGRDLFGVRKDGSEVPVEIALTPVTMRDGPFVVAAITDISERKQAEHRLRRERDRARQYFDVAGVMMVVLDREGRVKRINRKGCDLLGIPSEELIGRDWFDTALPVRHRERVRELFRKIDQGQIVPDGFFESTVVTRSGEERTVLWFNAVLRDEHAQISGTLSSGEDVTERNRGEAALRQADQLKTDFLLIASHELRTPISYILGLVHLLSRTSDPGSPPRVTAAMESIAAKARRLNEIILAMFKLIPGELRPERMHYSQVALDAMLDAVREEVAPFLEERRQRLDIDLPAAPAPPLPDIQADQHKLRDVLENLVMNAIKYTPDGGRIGVTVRPADGGRVTIAVRDGGAGIAPEDLPYLFKPFFSGGAVFHHSTGAWQYQKSGVGLGLTIVKQFVEMHGGTVTVQAGPDGSTFTVTLPTHPPGEKPPGPPAERGLTMGIGGWI